MRSRRRWLRFWSASRLPVSPDTGGLRCERQAWLLLHVAAGGVALLTGPVQLWLGVSARAMQLHRRLGLVYVAAVAAGSVAAFYLAAHTNLGWDSAPASRPSVSPGW